MSAVRDAVLRSMTPMMTRPTVETMIDNQDAQIQTAQQQVLDEARKVNEERLKAVEDLAAAVARRVDLEKQVHEAKKEEKRLMTAAEKHGWTRAQVNKFARAPKATGKRTQQSSSTPQQSGTATGGAVSTGTASQ